MQMQLAKFALIAITGCTICGASYRFYQKPEPSIDEKIKFQIAEVAESKNQSDVYYARQAIPRGSVINMAFLSTQRISSKNIPLGAVTTFSQLSDCIARNQIPSGKIIETRDLLPVRSALESTDAEK